MLIHTIRIDDQAFVLAAGENVAKLKKRIRRAAGSKPAFVAFTPVGHGPVAVLMTSNTSVIFEEAYAPDERSGNREDEALGLHFEFEFGYGATD